MTKTVDEIMERCEWLVIQHREAGARNSADAVQGVLDWINQPSESKTLDISDWWGVVDTNDPKCFRRAVLSFLEKKDAINYAKDSGYGYGYGYDYIYKLSEPNILISVDDEE